MEIGELFYSTLSALPCHVSTVPAGGKHMTYATFNLAYGKYQNYASNEPHRTYHMVQVHVFSLEHDGTHRALMYQAIELLRAVGVKVRSWGPDEYEADTRYYHIAVTCEIGVTISLTEENEGTEGTEEIFVGADSISALSDREE